MAAAGPKHGVSGDNVCRSCRVQAVTNALCAAQVETGSAITWKYPSVVLKGDNSIGEFYSVALTNNAQQADTGAWPCYVSRVSVLPHDSMWRRMCN